MIIKIKDTAPRWRFLRPNMTYEHLGYLPTFLDKDDPLPAAKQIDKNYKHGGGWHPFKDHTLSATMVLKYPGDPPIHPVAETYLREEHILLYQPGSWIVIIQPDKTWEVACVD